MPVVSCPNPGCGRRSRIADTASGRPVRCKACGQPFVAGDTLTHGLDQSAQSTPRPDPAGDGSVGRFRLRGQLGSGAFGTVYRAYDPHLDREVALKVPHPGTLDRPQRVERFLREAKAAANLRHPHIVPVYDAGRDGDRYYIASAFIDGKPLADDIPDGGLPFSRAARIVQELAGAVGYAHEQGIVHRDIKPANVMVDRAGRPHLMDFGLAARADEESRLTSDGAVLGTAAYMPPEQARGDTASVGPASDQYALGVVLYELLTGKVPFSGPVPVVIHNQIHTEPDPPRKHRPDVPRDLETICLKALAKRPGDRYEDCQELADDLRRFLEGEPISARRLSLGEHALRWVKKYPGRAAAVAGILLVVVAAVTAAFRVQRAMADQHLAAETQRLEDLRAAEVQAARALTDERLAAERKRLDDLRAADLKAAAKISSARAESLVGALEVADTEGVPRLVAELAEVREWARPGLGRLAQRPVETRPGLHARLALLADEPALVVQIAAYLPACRPEELLVLRQFLRPHAGTVSETLWSVLADPKAPAGPRIRSAAALAAFAPADQRWRQFAYPLSELVVRENPLHAVTWAAALEPVRDHLVPALMFHYWSLQNRVAAGRPSGLVQAADAPAANSLAMDLAASLLARYAAERPTELANLALTLEPQHYRFFAEAIGRKAPEVVPVLRAVLSQRVGGWSQWHTSLAAVAGVPAAGRFIPADAHARLRGFAAASLLTLGESEAVWPLFRLPPNAADPTERSYFLARLAGIGGDPIALVRRFATEPDISAKRALLVALGDTPADAVPEAERAPFQARLLTLYREHPDAGLHSAIDWLLRRRWGQAKLVAAIDSELAAAARAGRGPAGTLPSGGKEWFVNAEGQTFSVVRVPVAAAGNGGTVRRVAVSTKEVTVEQFRRFSTNHQLTKAYSPGPDTPVISVTWYAAAQYCNWLSERDGIPKDQWCYEPNPAGRYDEGMRVKPGHLRLKGYRLPADAEWVYAARAGATTVWPFGWGEELLPRYGWVSKNAFERSWPVGQLRPNEWGLFDVVGNVYEWTCTLREGTPGDENAPLTLTHTQSFASRGGSFRYGSGWSRFDYRHSLGPENRDASHGFRPVRTLPD